MTVQNRKIRRVLIVRGAYGDMYEPAWYRALNEIGIETEIFDSHANMLPGILGRIEQRVLWGAGVLRTRRRLAALVESTRPDVTLFYQGHYYDGPFLERLRSYTFVAGYHNDDPFGPRRHMLRYRHLLPALKSYHGFHVYRPCNVEEALAHGVPRAGLLMPYYIPWQDVPRQLDAEARRRWGCDLVFAGHVEDDYRAECISRAVRSSARVRVYGEDKYWRQALPPDVYDALGQLSPVRGDEYRLALSGAKIASCFFSKWNRDQYTRRAFEIPACGVFLLSERTDQMMELYQEGREAEYFSSPEEFSDKLRYYIANDSVRMAIAKAGYERVIRSGHDIYSRMRQWLADVERWRNEL